MSESFEEFKATSIFPIGEPNNTYAAYFSGKSWLAPLCDGEIPTSNVTFEPGCRNNWHIHHAEKGGGQLLICVKGSGYYQEWEKPARKLNPGDVVVIPANVKHWHGASSNSFFSHLAQSIPGINCSTEWCEPVSDAAFAAATS